MIFLIDLQDNVITKAIVVFNVGTVGDGGVKGTLELSQKDASSPVHINGTLTGLKPKGLHGFHIHESGDIREGCKSARGHFNPKKVIFYSIFHIVFQIHLNGNLHIWQEKCLTDFCCLSHSSLLSKCHDSHIFKGQVSSKVIKLLLNLQI
jgi:hypothetical protein